MVNRRSLLEKAFDGLYCEEERYMSYQTKRAILFSIGILWFVLFSLQGFGVFGSSIEPMIWHLPFSVFYTLSMGVWGVLMVILFVKVLGPEFYRKAEIVLKESENKDV